MASTNDAPFSGTAPWRSAFMDTLSKMDQPEFVLSTLHAAGEGYPTPYVPRARFCIFRGMWTELPENKHNTAERNPRGVYGSDMPTLTTDVRMEKVGELFGTSKGKADKEEQMQGSGGGGPVEAVWWAKDEGVQWRIKGSCFVVDSGDIESSNDSGVRTVKTAVGEWMRCLDEGKKGDWSWAREVEGHFGHLSPGMRGTFRAPQPGMKFDEPYDDKKLSLGVEVEDLKDPVARKHFRVLIIKPDTVEKLFLKDPTKAQRWRWTFDKAARDWKEEELWP